MSQPQCHPSRGSTLVLQLRNAFTRRVLRNVLNFVAQPVPGQSGNDYHHLGKSCRRTLGSPLPGGADASDFIQNSCLTPLLRGTPAGVLTSLKLA